MPPNLFICKRNIIIMKIKRPFLITLVLLSLALSSFAGERQVVIQFMDGSRSAFLLSEEPIMTFRSHQLNISTMNGSVSFELQQVEKFFFNEDGETSIKTKKDDKDLTISYQDKERLVIKLPQSKTPVRLYGLDGVNYQTSIMINGGFAEISLSSLPKGIYVINVNNRSIKINKQ